MCTLTANIVCFALVDYQVLESRRGGARTELITVTLAPPTEPSRQQAWRRRSWCVAMLILHERWSPALRADMLPMDLQRATRRPMSIGGSGCASWPWRRLTWPRCAELALASPSRHCSLTPILPRPAGPHSCSIGPLHPPHPPRHARVPPLPDLAHQRGLLPRTHAGQKASDQPRAACGARKQGEWPAHDPASARRRHEWDRQEAIYQDWAAG